MSFLNAGRVTAGAVDSIPSGSACSTVSLDGLAAVVEVDVDMRGGGWFPAGKLWTLTRGELSAVTGPAAPVISWSSWIEISFDAMRGVPSGVETMAKERFFNGKMDAITLATRSSVRDMRFLRPFEGVGDGDVEACFRRRRDGNDVGGTDEGPGAGACSDLEGVGEARDTGAVSPTRRLPPLSASDELVLALTSSATPFT